MICPTCGTSSKTREFSDIARMMKCVACRLDIATAGTWGGIGQAAMMSLCNAIGRDKVVREYKRQRDGAPKNKNGYSGRQPGIPNRH